MRARLPITLALLLAACGDTLVDHDATDLRDSAGQPATCTPGTATCSVDGERQCLPDTTTQCGSGCDNCVATISPPSGAEVACLRNPDAQSTCGWQCQGGFFNCGAACCGAGAGEVALAAGAAHTCAVSADGRLLCWGRNAEGQVTGTPTADAVLTPHEVFAGGVTAVAAGTAHTCATVSGQVRCFGDDTSGEAPATRAVNAVELAAGERHTCAREAGGRVTCWGALDLGQTGGGTPITSGAVRITAGADHSCALLATGAVQCWGTNAAGELGNTSAGAFSSTPVLVAGGIVAIGAGAHHTCASDGTRDVTPLLCWGANASGAGGLQVLPGLATPQLVPAEPLPGGQPVNYGVAKIGGGRLHTCVQRAGEGIKCFGAAGADGQLGAAPAPEDVDVAGVPFGATALAVGDDHACVVFPDRTVHCWGRNDQGQLGNGTSVTPAPGTVVSVLGR